MPVFLWKGRTLAGEAQSGSGLLVLVGQATMGSGDRRAASPSRAWLDSAGALARQSGECPAGPGQSTEAQTGGQLTGASPGPPPATPPGQFVLPGPSTPMPPAEQAHPSVGAGVAPLQADPKASGARMRSLSRRAVSARGEMRRDSRAPAGRGGVGVPSAAAPGPEVDPGSLLWRERLEQAGAPVGSGQSSTARHFENGLLRVSDRLGRPPVFPGVSTEATAADQVVPGVVVWNLRDHIGQLTRELAQLDAALVAGFFGQMASPPLRRALVTVVGNLRPVIQEPPHVWVRFLQRFPVFSAVLTRCRPDVDQI